MVRHHVEVTKPDLSVIEDQVDSSELAAHLARHAKPGVTIRIDGICITPANSATNSATNSVDLIKELSHILIERERQLAKIHIERERQLADAWDQQREAQAELTILGRSAAGASLRDHLRRSSAARSDDFSWQSFLHGAARTWRKMTNNND